MSDEIQVKSKPVQWYELIREMEEFRARTGWGLAGTWSWVHAEDYEVARRYFEASKQVERNQR